MKKGVNRFLKTPDQIADDIFACGEAAFSAARFPQLLDEKVKAAGYTGDLSHIKLSVATICNIRRRNHRRVA